MRTTIITHGYSPPILEPAKHDLDFMTFFIHLFVIINWLFAILSRWNTRTNASCKQCLAKPCRIIATIRQKLFGPGQGIQQHGRALVIAHLTRREQETHGLARSIAHCMQFGVQTSFGASDTARKSPFFSRLAAVR